MPVDPPDTFNPFDPDAYDDGPDAPPSSSMPSPGVSARQVAANRANAQRSTGPKTALGKTHASYNGLKHGLYARDVVLPGEDRAAYDELLAHLSADLKPRGRVEDGLVRRCADIWWRLGRTAAIEAGFLNPDWSGDPRAARYDTGGGPVVDGFRVALDETATLDRLGRYEARLERALKRTLDILARMQTARRRAAKPASASAPADEDGRNASGHDA